MLQRRVDEARSMRDKEINHLENLDRLTERQEVRLRTLRLEKEFQRRAEELNHDDEDDDDVSIFIMFVHQHVFPWFILALP